MSKEVDDQINLFERVKGQTMGLASALSTFLLPSSANVWYRSSGDLSKSGILKGLARDIRGMKLDAKAGFANDIDPVIVRQHYKSIHSIPEEVLSQSNSIEFTPSANKFGTTPVIENDGGFRFAFGSHKLSSNSSTGLKDYSQIKLSTSTAHLTPTQKETLYKNIIKNPRETPVHETTHTYQRNQRVRETLPKEIQTKLVDLEKQHSSSEYSSSILENMANKMGEWQNYRRQIGKRITQEDFNEHFKLLVNEAHKKIK